MLLVLHNAGVLHDAGDRGIDLQNRMLGSCIDNVMLWSVARFGLSGKVFCLCGALASSFLFPSFKRCEGRGGVLACNHRADPEGGG